MGAVGRRDQVVGCGWSSTARDLVAELAGEDYRREVVVLHAGEISEDLQAPAVSWVRGDAADAVDVTRAGIGQAEVAVICPAETTDQADMRSILALMAIESVAPQVRTVVVVNNPARVDHFRREGADEVVVASRIASRLIARSSLFPGLAETVTDLVSGYDGTALHRVTLLEDHAGLTVDELSAHLRRQHRATLVAISRDGRSHVNPATDFVLQPGDDLVVVAESPAPLASLAPLGQDETPAAMPTQARPRSAQATGAVAAPLEA